MKEIHAHDPAGRAAEEYNVGRGAGPDEDDLRLDMSKLDSAWNQAVVRALARHCMTVQESEGWQPEQPVEYFQAMLFERLEDFTTEWNKAVPRGNETLAAAAARREQELEDETTQNRRAGRRARVSLQLSLWGQ